MTDDKKDKAEEAARSKRTEADLVREVAAKLRAKRGEHAKTARLDAERLEAIAGHMDQYV